MGKRELISAVEYLYVVSVRRDFLFHSLLGIDCVEKAIGLPGKPHALSNLSVI